MGGRFGNVLSQAVRQRNLLDQKDQLKKDSLIRVNKFLKDNDSNVNILNWKD